MAATRGHRRQEWDPHCWRRGIRSRPRRRPARHQAVELVSEVQLVRREQPCRGREGRRRLEHLAAGVRVATARGQAFERCGLCSQGRLQLTAAVWPVQPHASRSKLASEAGAACDG